MKARHFLLYVTRLPKVYFHTIGPPTLAEPKQVISRCMPRCRLRRQFHCSLYRLCSARQGLRGRVARHKGSTHSRADNSAVAADTARQPASAYSHTLMMQRWLCRRFLLTKMRELAQQGSQVMQCHYMGRPAARRGKARSSAVRAGFGRARLRRSRTSVILNSRCFK